MKKLSFSLLTTLAVAVLALAGSGQAQNSRLKSFGEMSWIGGEGRIFSNTVQVNIGDWVEYRIQCNTGEYIKYCGLPEYYNIQTGELIKFNCSQLWTIGPTTEQVCGLVSPASGSFRVSIMVLYQGIPYIGTYEVTAGPNN